MELTDTHKKLLVLCAKDHVGLWFAMTPIEDNFKEISADEVRKRTLGTLRDLIEMGLIQAGFPTPDGRGFKAWHLSVDETIARIDNEWVTLGRDPTIGEIVWFTSTEKGDKEVEKLRAQEGGKK